nr:hypothetical protein [Tanacetum cinerariifolium]
DDTAAHGEVLTVTQEPSIPSPTPTIPPSQPPQDIPLTSQVQQTPPNHLRRVEYLEYDKVAQALEITKFKRRRVDTSDDTVMDDESNQGRMIDEMDKDDAVVLMDEKEEDKKTKEQIEEEKNRALQTINETPAQKAAKRRKLNEEVEGLKRNLEIVPDEDDDVYTEATPLVRKVPVVDYKIIELNNKPYKIIRPNGTHQLYIRFLTLLKNFDREDLEALWSLVKERFSTSKPKNFSDDFLLTTLGAMFEKPDAVTTVNF